MNWNGWADTAGCLESLLRSRYRNFQVVVCDNGSTDDSIERLVAWASGHLDVRKGRNPVVDSLTHPPIRKPVALSLIGPESNPSTTLTAHDAQVVLIDVGKNGGFAAGCNAGINYAARRGDLDFVWLLNNDTIVRPDTLTELVHKAASDPRVGMCGSTIAFYDRPYVIQARGGAHFNRIRGRSRHLGEGDQWSGDPASLEDSSTRMDYVMGASLLVSRAFLSEVGLLDEAYFLYYEEIDWALRGRRASGHYRLAYAPKSVVFHRQGGSSASVNSYVYTYRNQLLLSRKHYPWLLPLIAARLAVTYVVARLRSDRLKCEAFESAQLLSARAWRAILAGRPLKLEGAECTPSSSSAGAPS